MWFALQSALPDDLKSEDGVMKLKIIVDFSFLADSAPAAKNIAVAQIAARYR